MAATVIINRYNGASPVATNITNANIVGGTADTAQVQNASASADPIQVPLSGLNYGYWVNTGLEVTVAPATQINNVRWYTDGTNNLGTGVTILVTDSAQTVARSSYSRATGTPGVTGNQIATSYNGGIAVVDAFSKTSSSPIIVGNGSIGATTGALGNFVVYQFQVGPSASSGPTPVQETIVWAFDES